MIDIAKTRFADNENINYIIGDYIEYNFGGAKERLKLDRGSTVE
ncbi:hypothetical protein ACMCNP_00180 [Candidatus Acidulodesulfobacterium sp. H_13]